MTARRSAIVMMALGLGLPCALEAQSAPAPAATAGSAATPFRLVFLPGPRTLTAGDTLRVRAEVRDSLGRPVPDALVRYFGSGGRFEGTVDSTGLVHAGATGAIGVTAIGLVPGSRPVYERIDLRVVPGPAASVVVTPEAARLVVGQRMRLKATVYSRLKEERDDTVIWRSSAPRVARVSGTGMVTALAPGRAVITAAAGDVRGTVTVRVVANTIASIEISPSTVEARQGDVIRFTATPLDRNGAPIEGLTPTWSFSPGQGMIDPDGAFVGYEPGEYVVTASFGNRTADAVVTLTHRDVRRPVTVVGRLPRTLFKTEEVWIHPSGKYAYLGTGGGGDRMYAIDISDPARPVVTDSIVANTRRVNDVMTTPDGKFLVFTREGASDRRNGIVIASLEDPAHPKPIAEFTEGVTAGVHSAFVYRQAKYGTHVYLTNDGTGALHIVDLNDPYHPKEVAQWRTDRPDAARTLHDVDVQDGLAYLSYWNDGLVILDVGNGIKGGSPSNPKLVSQYKYDLNELYRDVELTAGPGFIRGTHTAWRHRNYVFIADEVFPAREVAGAKDAAAGRAYGRLQVIDVSDIERPRAVAWYEPEYGGVHNVWVAGDTLYMGAYDAGFRAFDVSGELRGDLRAQRREIAHLNTADMDGNIKNTANTWGVVVHNGLAYVNDNYNGLWIVRIEPRRTDPVP
ncbi:MAG TPA: Ig-like domain-containing protein [Gemmatimonadales bacterium]|nr:Ig-like domain-containing protein [Gemmatimonadales bacterium]